MSATQFVVNNTASPMFFGGRMIPPGEGRDVPLLYLPAHLQDAPAPAPAPAAPNLDEQLLALLTMPGGVKAIALQLPELTHEALSRLDELESAAATPRKTLLAAVVAEQLRRADEMAREGEGAGEGAGGGAGEGDGTDADDSAAAQDADFQAQMDATHAAQLAQLSDAERAALAEPLTHHPV